MIFQWFNVMLRLFRGQVLFPIFLAVCSFAKVQAGMIIPELDLSFGTNKQAELGQLVQQKGLVSPP